MDFNSKVILGVFLLFIIAMIIGKLIDNSMVRESMKYGYVQCAEGGQLLWKKSCEH